MLRLTLKGLLAHKLRLAATAAAIMLGVAFMAGTLVLTDTIGKTFDDLFADVYEGTDAVVRQEASFSSPNGGEDQRGRVDAAVLDDVAAIDGVAVAEGTVQGYARLLDKEGEPIGNLTTGAPTFGASWGENADLNPFQIVEGAPPAVDDEAVIDKKSADDAGFQVGDTATVVVQGPPVEVVVSGIATFGEADSPGGSSFVLFTTPAAQRLVGEPGKFDAISVLGDDGVSQPELAERISGVIPTGAEVLTGAEITAESQDAIQDGLSFFNTFMLVFAVIALLVGSFMIFNTFSITVAQRSRESALLRAIGASRRQILGAVLVEAVVVGLLASIVGLAAGLLVAMGLQALLDGFGFDIPSGGVVFEVRTVIVSVGAGLLITLLAALSPARKASKVPPVAALRDVVAGRGGYGSKQRVLVGAGVLGLGVAALLAGLFGGGSNTIALVGLGALLVFFGVAIFGRTIALPLSRLIGMPLPRMRGITGALARENAMRNPKRTAATASALMIGVGLVVFITILAASTRSSIDASIEKAFTGDFAVDAGTFGFGGLDPGLADSIDALDAVESATAVRLGVAEVAGGAEEVLGVDPRSAFDILDVEPVEGQPADLGVDDIAVFEDVAEDEGLALGDPVAVLFKDTGPTELTVAMIYGEDQPVGDFLIGLDAYEANFADQYASTIYITKAQGVPEAAAKAAIEEVVASSGADVLDRSGFIADQTAEIDLLLGLVYALLSLAVLIALLGISNALALSILERTRELGLLRSVGMTRSQLRSTIRWESVIIALQGTALGLGIGVFFGWALVEALADEGIDRLDLPLATLLVIVALAGIAGVLAAIVPAHRAAKLDVLRAVVTE